jgi:predicted secreted protein
MALLFVLATLALGPASNGHTYSVAPATKIVVTLPSNRSTGYHWRLRVRPDPHVVKLVSHHYVVPKTKRVGAAGKEIWRFRAVGAGSVKLRLVYVQAGRVGGRLFGIGIHVR